MPPSTIDPVSLRPGLAPVVDVVVLLPSDTCDQCGPGVTANCAVRLISGGTLTFCLHCYSGHAPALLPLMVAFTQNTVS